VRARDKEDPKNLGVSIFFKTNTVLPTSPTKEKEGETKELKEGDVAAEKPAEKPADKHDKELTATGEKTFVILEAETKAEAYAWIAALIKAHSEEGNIPQQALMLEETERLREARALKEKKAEELAKIEGDLRKLKHSNKLGIGAWQTRFFSLDAEFFSYYKSNKKGEPLGFFPVTQMVCVGTSPLQEETCFFFRLPSSYSAGDGKYLKSGAPASPSISDGEGEEKAEKLPDKDTKAKDPIILLRCTSTAERDRWIQAFVDLGVKKAHGKDKPGEQGKPEVKPDEKEGDKAESGEKVEKADAAPSSEASSSPSAASSSPSASSTPTLLPVQDD